MSVPAKTIATCLSLAAFAVATLAGLAADVPAAQILLRSVVAMLLCYPVGWAVGSVAASVIHAHLRAMEPATTIEAGASPSHSSGVSANAADEEAIVV